MKLFVYLFFGFGLFVVSCSGDTAEQETVVQDRSTDTRSTELATAQERVNFLGEYLSLESEVADADFHIIFRDNSGSGDRDIPGPSDWSYTAIIKLANSATIDQWTADLAAGSEFELKPFEQLDAPNVGLVTDSEPEFYGGNWAVFRDEGVVYYRASTS